MKTVIKKAIQGLMYVNKILAWLLAQTILIYINYYKNNHIDNKSNDNLLLHIFQRRKINMKPLEPINRLKENY